MKKIITKNEYYIIAGLLFLATEARKKVEECERAYIDIVKLEQTQGLDSGHFGDGVWQGYSVDEILKSQGIKVK